VRPAVVSARTFAEDEGHDIGQLFECRTGLERALEMLEQTRLGAVLDRQGKADDLIRLLAIKLVNLIELRSELRKPFRQKSHGNTSSLVARRIAFLGKHTVDVNQRQIDPHADEHNTGHPACPKLELPQPIKRLTDGVSTNG